MQNDNAVVTSVPESQMNHHNVHRCPEDSSARRPRRRYVWFAVVMAVVTASVASFLLGFCCGDRIKNKRGWQRFLEILQVGVDMGKVDEGWAKEVEIINHEADYDDDDED